MSKNFLNMHVLISHSPSCLNRDDMNMQKSAIFGGKRRVRVSSQSLKRAIRTSDYYSEKLGAPSIRTRELTTLKDVAVQALGDEFEQDVVITAIEWIAGKEGIAVEEGVQASAMAPWAISEIAEICKAIVTGRQEGLDDKKLQKQIEKSSQQFKAVFESAVDIALSGRMATSGLMTNVDGALAVAHAITTHSVDADIDWFTAVDDLIVDEGEMGAGHLNTQEFSSGVFYRYASLNIGQLQKNLGDCSRQKALEVARHFIHLFATVVPSAKQQTFAAHNLADTVLLSFADQPLSLANAFETPVKADANGGFRQPSSKALLDHHAQLVQAYGLEEESRLFTLLNLESEVETAAGMIELGEWVLAQE
ncbi:MAG: type I-E CRISPR-associated protein Cas7/Cse4/CasC [Gammaproteobacteria bacterium]|nr:MAG: type I-E CRISPR-associated protein Cas7/Cse4/CasC [Gammaproteobacteria bacterium]